MTRWTMSIAVAALALGAAPALAHDRITPPEPATPIASWFAGENYPPAAIRAAQEGRVSVMLSIGTGGAVVGCAVTDSSGFPLLDAQTCLLATRHGSFRPAQQSGHTVASTFPLRGIAWRIRNTTAVVVPQQADATAGGREP